MIIFYIRKYNEISDELFWFFTFILILSISCDRMWPQRRPKTSGRCVRERRDSVSRDPHSIGWSQTLCVKVETSPIIMEPEESPSMALSLQTKTSLLNTPDPAFSRWPTQVLPLLLIQDNKTHSSVELHY